MQRTFQTKDKRFTIEAEIKSKRPCAPYLSVDLEPIEGFATTLSISGTVHERTSDGLWRDSGCGQIVDEFRAAFLDDVEVQRLCDIWGRHHLGDLNAGSREQKAILDAYFERIGKRYDYGVACDVLKLEGKLDVPIPGQLVYSVGPMPEYNRPRYWPFEKRDFAYVAANLEGGIYATKEEARKSIVEKFHKIGDTQEQDYGSHLGQHEWNKVIPRIQPTIEPQQKMYRYGSAWLCESLPGKIVVEVQAIMEQGDTTEPETMAKTLGVTIDCQKTDSNPNMSGQDMNHWRCVLRRLGHQLTTVYSTGRGHGGLKPTADQVLECLLMAAASVQFGAYVYQWSEELGYQVNTETERLFKATNKRAAKLEQFLGDSFEETV